MENYINDDIKGNITTYSLLKDIDFGRKMKRNFMNYDTAQNNGFVLLPLLLTIAGWYLIKIKSNLKGYTKFATRKKKGKKHRNQPYLDDEISGLDYRLRRKMDFINKNGEVYGYKLSPAGHIDTWRMKEFPNLIPPISHQNRDNEENKNVNENDQDGKEAEVYLDYAGAALPTSSQLQETLLAMSTGDLSLLANPHSSGPAANRTLLSIQKARKLIIDHFGCEDNDANHPGYDILFTSGATQSLNIIASSFPWFCPIQKHNKPYTSHQSILIYSHNVHTSVIGMRGPAQLMGAHFRCESLENICNATEDTFFEWQFNHDISDDCNNFVYQDIVNKDNDNSNIHIDELDINHLLVIPAECNFGGDRPDIASIIAKVKSTNAKSQLSRKKGSYQHKWHTMIDIAKLAATKRIDLCSLDPDFACVSFYKLFGYPTGLGALFVKRSCTTMLTNVNKLYNSNDLRSKRYFGGGSIDVVLPRKDFVATRSNVILDSLAHGTCHYRGIATLKYGFQELNRLGGIEKISAHSSCLAKEFVKRLQMLHHANGKPLILIYGAWKSVQLSNESNSKKSSYISHDIGPTISFNVLRDDGSFVGCNEVANLASISKPPIQLRTGCFCNPGACQDALGLSDKQIIENYTIGGHVCGDHKDLINGMPTGAVRVSFGKDSIWEDLDAIVLFFSRYFLNEYSAFSSHLSRKINESNTKKLSQTNGTCKLSEIYVFPIKSCAAFRVKKWPINTCTGRLHFDREFALVDSNGSAMRLQSYPDMCHIYPEIDLQKNILTIKAKSLRDLIINLDDGVSESQHLESKNTNQRDVVICGNCCPSYRWGDHHVSDWFSSFLGVKCFLVKYDNKKQDQVRNEKAMKTDSTQANVGKRRKTAFANDAPLLLISKESVNLLNSILLAKNQKLVNSRHFRPNFVVQRVRDDNETGGASSSFSQIESNPEDNWSTITLSDHNLELSVVGQCARCAMVDVDPTSGMKGKTLRALADYRRRNGSITFGIFLSGKQANSATGGEVWIEEGELIRTMS